LGRGSRLSLFVMIGLVVLADFPPYLILIDRQKFRTRSDTQTKTIKNFRKAITSFRIKLIDTFTSSIDEFLSINSTNCKKKERELRATREKKSIFNRRRETDERVIKYFSRLVAEISEYLGRNARSRLDRDGNEKSLRYVSTSRVARRR
jgi:hypothetical protein